MKEKEEKLMRQLDRDQQRQQQTLDRYHEQDAARNQHASRKDPLSAPGTLNKKKIHRNLNLAVLLVKDSVNLKSVYYYVF